MSGEPNAEEVARRTLPGIWLWVHAVLPNAADLGLYDGAIVRAANGNGTVGDGHDFAQSFRDCVNRFGAARCAAWTFLYPRTTHGATAAETLVRVAPNAPAYIADVEDYEGQPGASLPEGEINAFFDRMHALRPGVPVGFSSYPTRAQAVAHWVLWDKLIARCDFGAPQVYWPKQLQNWATVVHGHGSKPIHAAFAPTLGGAPFLPVAKAAFARYGGVSIWSHPVPAEWKPAIAQIRDGSGHPRVHVAVDLPRLDLSYADTSPVHDPAVSRLQGLLVAAGMLAASGIDGTAGFATRAAVVAFQRQNELDPDAVVGQKTWSALVAPESPAPPLLPFAGDDALESASEEGASA
jgi:hypothetical protein